MFARKVIIEHFALKMLDNYGYCTVSLKSSVSILPHILFIHLYCSKQPNCIRAKYSRSTVMKSMLYDFKY